MTGEAGIFKVAVGWDEVGGPDAGDAAEEPVKRGDDGAAAPTGGSCGGDFEVCQQPVSGGRRHFPKFRDHLRELVGREAIEEKVGDDEVVAGGRTDEFKNVGVDEIDPVGSGLAAGDGKHLAAGIDDGDVGLGEAADAFGEEPAVAFADDEDGARRRDFREETNSAALQFSAGGEQLHGAVKWGEAVEIHRNLVID